MINANASNAGLRSYQNEAKAITPFSIKKEDLEHTRTSDAGAFKTTMQISAKGEIYSQRMWWA